MYICEFGLYRDHGKENGDYIIMGHRIPNTPIFGRVNPQGLRQLRSIPACCRTRMNYCQDYLNQGTLLSLYIDIYIYIDIPSIRNQCPLICGSDDSGGSFGHGRIYFSGAEPLRSFGGKLVERGPAPLTVPSSLRCI